MSGEVFDLKSRLSEMGLSPKKAFGQNFLVSPLVINKIVEAVARRKHTNLLEIGPGLGALTEPLAQKNLKPQLIELDRDLVDHWRNRGYNVVDHDALKIDWDALNLKADSLLVSNLPYQISTHLVIDRCFGPHALKYMILMFQKEVAQRLTALPRTKEYGLLSIMAQLHFKIEKVADASPKDFYPPPKIASRVLAFERKPDPQLGTTFLKLLKAAFAQRRKFLLKNIKGVVDKTTAEQLPEIWAAQKLKPQARAEELKPEQWVSLYRALYERN